MIDWSFRFGDLFPLIGGIAIALAFIYRRGGDDAGIKLNLESMGERLDEMKLEFAEFSKALTQIAVQDTKIELLMKWYDELRRGIGRINNG